MLIGRPTKYNQTILDKAYKYLDIWQSLGDEIPSHLALAEYLEVTTATCYSWAKDEDKKDFLYILDQVKDKQHKTLLNNGLNGSFNATIAKLVLGKHGYTDKQDVAVSTSYESDFMKQLVSGLKKHG